MDVGDRPGLRPVREYRDHFEVDQYGDFRLTGAIRPSLDLQVVPRQGYRVETYRDADTGTEIPMIAAAASEEILFDLFSDLLSTMGMYSTSSSSRITIDVGRRCVERFSTRAHRSPRVAKLPGRFSRCPAG